MPYEPFDGSPCPPPIFDPSQHFFYLKSQRGKPRRTLGGPIAGGTPTIHDNHLVLQELPRCSLGDGLGRQVECPRNMALSIGIFAADIDQDKAVRRVFQIMPDIGHICLHRQPANEMLIRGIGCCGRWLQHSRPRMFDSHPVIPFLAARPDLHAAALSRLVFSRPS